MRITDLYGKHQGQPIYIVGTGPSMRVFPVKLLDDAVTIGLNQAWRYRSLTYSITVHPELVREWAKNKGHVSWHDTQWAIGLKPTNRAFRLDDPVYYVFHTDPYPGEDNIAYVKTPTPDKLYQGRGVHTCAINLALNLGASVIYLIGVDMASLDAEHHGHQQHVYFGKHRLPTECYREYRESAARLRRVARDKGVPILTLSPFLGIDAAQLDYVILCRELHLPRLPEPKDLG